MLHTVANILLILSHLPSSPESFELAPQIPHFTDIGSLQRDGESLVQSPSRRCSPDSDSGQIGC